MKRTCLWALFVIVFGFLAVTLFAETVTYQTDYKGNLSGVVVRPESGVPLPVTGAVTTSGTATVSGTVTTIPSGKQVVQGGSSLDTAVFIQDGGNSMTVDNTYLDTNLTLLLSQLKLIDTSKIDTNLNTSLGYVQALLSALNKTNTPAMADVTLNIPTIYEITLTDTSTVDSSIDLPAKCVGFEFWGQTNTHTIKWMINSGTYAVQCPGVPYNTFDKGINALYSGRLYLKDTTEAGAKVTVIVWTKP